MQFGVALGLLDHHPVRSTENIVAVLYNALAIAELRLPSVSKGAFIPVGNTFDVLSALSKTFLAAERDVLIIDPYMDNRVLTDFAPLAAEGVNIRLLTDQKSCAPTFAPAVQRWKSQYAKKRPLSARLAPARTLHDRLIIVDATEVCDPDPVLEGLCCSLSRLDRSIRHGYRSTQDRCLSGHLERGQLS